MVVLVAALVPIPRVDGVGGAIDRIFAVWVGARLTAQEDPIGGCRQSLVEIVADYCGEVMRTVERRSVSFPEVDLIDGLVLMKNS